MWSCYHAWMHTPDVPTRRRHRTGSSKFRFGSTAAGGRGCESLIRCRRCAPGIRRFGEGRIGEIGFAEAVGVAVSRQSLLRLCATVSILWGDPVGSSGGGSGRRNQASGDVDTSPTWIGWRSTIEFVTRWS